MSLQGTLHNQFGRCHHTQVFNLKAVAGHHHAHNILSDIVHITLHGSHQHLSGRRTFHLLRLNKRLQNAHGLLHRAGCLDHLRQEHLSGAEQIAHGVHTGHQRSFDNIHRMLVTGAGLIQIFLQIVADTFNQGILQALLYGCFTPQVLLLMLLSGHSCLLGFHAFGYLHHAFRSVGTAIEHQIFDCLKHIRRNIAIHHRSGRIYDTHIHALLCGIIKEYGMNGLTDIIVSSERERQIAHASTHMCPRQIAPDPSGSFDKVHRIMVMFLHSRSNGQHIRIENDVMRIEAHLFCKQTIGSLAHFYLAGISIGLPLLVECHHHHGGTEATDAAGMMQKHLLAFFQRNGIDDTLALQTLQSGLDHIPFRRVDHDRNAGNFRLRSQQIQESDHLLTGIEQSVVHIDIEHQSTVFHLFAGDAQSLFIFLFVDESQELA